MKIKMKRNTKDKPVTSENGHLQHEWKWGGIDMEWNETPLGISFLYTSDFWILMIIYIFDK